MKSLQLLAMLGLFSVIQVISSIPVDIDFQETDYKTSTNHPTSENEQIQLDIELQDSEELEEPEPSEEFKAELHEHFEQLKNKAADHERESRQSSGGIYHGHTIALQTPTRNLWLGCAGDCTTYSCPGFYFEGSEWTHRCGGEVFRLYRADGPGYIRAGDYVGVYYPAANRWLGCAHSSCGKYDCPGSPSWQHGFSSREKWYRCGGEVFRIYARGKGEGYTINAYDDIMLYYVGNGHWLSLLPHEHATKRTCPGSHRPPPSHKFEECGGEVFKIWKQ